MKSVHVKTATGLVFLAVAVVYVVLFCAGQEDPAFVEAEMTWRAERDHAMREETSWLTIAGLFWLEEGENTFGTSADSRIQLPEDSAPESAGAFILKNGGVTAEAAGNTELKIGEEIIRKRKLASDQEGRPDIVALNDLRMWVIVRGGRFAIRMRDLNARAFREYDGLDFFPPRAEYKVVGTLITYDEPKTVSVGTAIGTTTEMTSPGFVSFEIGGKQYRLDAFGSVASKRLFFVFRDGTSGDETYGASRFMSADILEDGSVDMNFNRAYNPPCAYTHYATCPLPPPQNNLEIRIEAGEKMYPGHH